MMKLWSVALVAMLAVVHLDADARRMGGGKSVGKQSSNVTQREASPPAAPAAPAQNANNAAAAKPAAAPNAAAAAAPKKPWGAMLGGLAAGLGLAWLAHSLGLGEAFGQFLLIALLALVAFAVIGMVLRSRKPAGASAGGAPFAFQGAGAGAGSVSPAQAPMPRQYSPQNVGNDASARPFERGGMAFDASRTAGAGSGVVIGSAVAGAQGWSVPADFDTDAFLAAAKRNFVTLQAAWDRSDIDTLRSMMTDSMVGEIRTQLSERESLRGANQPNHTDVVMLEAQLLGIEDLGDGYMASVEFSGMIREELSAGPSPFREVWNMTKPKSGASGWLVAGVQALQ
ncbi:Tim44-like domain-containing protein [Acidovorax sp. GBBC 3334]|uniref:Tim44 domain-containing protein n=1 Tax=unclassified Acidovorax TaxID=2684926 RepID=UPI002302E83F|nr:MULTISPECIES: Tim44-like domain-containing protein [unclassified Acidovorax]MDA8456608.1 Tim44-like domain-containing protein [Acidovorax sp. GBBC 3334]MDA8522075.1 Tim44-like domain-containing protein [Acidovorax sp. NCPPB 4044]